MGSTWLYIEKFLQAFVLVLTSIGWYVSVVCVGWEWLYTLHVRNRFGAFYLVVVNVGITVCLSLYVYLCSNRATHSIARYPKPDQTQLIEPYPCYDRAGGFRVCTKGACNGNWAPPRSHHCSTCGVCRLDFDHHCPWVGNCVTIPRLKAFLLLLTLFCWTLAFALFPVRDVLWSHILLAIKTSQNTPLIKRYWWDWPGSWMIIAGPPGRWVVGAILGFVWIHLHRDAHSAEYSGMLVEEPHFRIVALFSIFVALALFSASLSLLTTFTCLRGSTTFESLGISGRRRTDLVCIPAHSGNSLDQPSVFAPEPHERLYDLGPRANLKKLWNLPLFPQTPPPEFSWPKLNPKMLQRMQALLRTVPTNRSADTRRKAD